MLRGSRPQDSSRWWVTHGGAHTHTHSCSEYYIQTVQRAAQGMTIPCAYSRGHQQAIRPFTPEATMRRSPSCTLATHCQLQLEVRNGRERLGDHLVRHQEALRVLETHPVHTHAYTPETHPKHTHAHTSTSRPPIPHTHPSFLLPHLTRPSTRPHAPAALPDGQAPVHKRLQGAPQSRLHLPRQRPHARLSTCTHNTQNTHTTIRQTKPQRSLRQTELPPSAKWRHAGGGGGGTEGWRVRAKRGRLGGQGIPVPTLCASPPTSTPSLSRSPTISRSSTLLEAVRREQARWV
jgi:hypothetical protein